MLPILAVSQILFDKWINSFEFNVRFALENFPNVELFHDILIFLMIG